ncbi:F-type H+-transporting ATPase oligomycin sensitivity conferral [Babesia microti strain RI]|uniref:F-type H+-transporting ATPase oligomycin sensitivity conferral n=1 Tax=Babesia microti (strain RI) TaxID=1133968 RepID=A0A1R4ACI0_BABMR|nr:F-type H+-transporting ATPase oligomycin sensitivity conferral [Babesia microti strain RI]SJK86700.1 F-type H+-transporting ATPase oligomycin sensitivity conferral [Babesia microti strain RI]|eukprot:XP_012649537.2 F-type H+-transporting ATPase oligomycin sensitivity conferral [Babesia microti strain RI]
MNRHIFSIISILCILVTPPIGCQDTKLSEFDQFTDNDIESRLSLSELDSAAESSESFAYQTEVTRLLDIIVNSIYTNKEIFIRELISNASDALEKARLNEIESNEPSHNLNIRVSFDDTTLSIFDSGIGMSKDDMMTNLGTIAKSGTKNFLNAMKENANANLIGQFGVGFYSAFLVADRVVVQSKRHGHDQYIWESSTSDHSYKIYKDPKGNTIPRGTRVTLFLKEDSKEYLNFDKLKTLINKYNSFIPHQIFLYGKPSSQPNLSIDGLNLNPEQVSIINSDGSANESKLSSEDETNKWHHLNDKQPLWLRPPKEVTDDEYKNFYKAISGDSQDPLTTIHFRGEGDVEFKALLFIPGRPPSEFLDYSKQSHNVKLYIKRVLVSVDLPNFIPRYLFNLYGIVDCEDMSLNISRETIQHNKTLSVVSKKIVRKVLDKISQLKSEDESNTDSNETTTFSKFWQSFQGSLKVGCYEDHSNRAKILDLLLFHSLRHRDGKLTLDKYIKEVVGDNKIIYYASGETYSQVEKIPQLQIFKKKDIDVLFLFDSLDESCLSRSASYKEFQFKSIQKGKLDLGDADKERHDIYKKVFKSFQSDLKDVLEDVSRVEYNDKLLDSPCAVQATEWGMSAQMERAMKSYTINKFDKGVVQRNKVFQVNPEHPLIVRLLEIHTVSGKSPEFTDAAKLIYDTAKLASGFMLEDSQTISNAAYQFLSEKIKVQSDTLDSLISKNSKLSEAVETNDGNASADSDMSMNLDDIKDDEL